MPGDPADVGSAPEHVVMAQVEDVFHGHVGADEVPAGGVDNAFGLAGGAGGVEDIQHVLAVAGLRRAIAIRVLNEPVVPVVPAFLDPKREVSTLDDDDVLDARRLLDRVVRVVLQGDDLPAAVSAVGGDKDFGLGVIDAVAQGLGAEAAEDDGVDCTDSRAGQHGDNRLGDHRQVDGHAVALFDPERLEGVGEQVDLAVQVAVSQHARVAWLAFPDDRRLVSLAGLDVTIHAVVAGVDLSPHEPFRMRWIPFEHARPRLEPVKPLRGCSPELLRVFPRPLASSRRAHIGQPLKLLRRLKPAFLDQQVRYVRFRPA